MSRYRHPVRTLAAFAVTALAIVLAPVSAARADTFWLPGDGDAVVGHLQGAIATQEDTLLDIGRRFNVGFEELKLANPGVDPWIPGDGTLIVIPSRFVLPDAPRNGIVLNLAEMRLYYYPDPIDAPQRRVITHPVSIGQVGWSTPLGTTNIAAKVANPTWYPPESIRAEAEADGNPLPMSVPPGPDNPLGTHALALGRKGYLIHGTNKPFGLGMRVSHGCVRMYPEDIVSMFESVPVDTPVHVVNQPVKTGWRDGVLYVEVHPAAGELELGGTLPSSDAMRKVVAVTSEEQAKHIRWEQVTAVVETLTGIPYAVSDPTIVQLKLAQNVDIVPVPDDLTLEARGPVTSPVDDFNVSLRWSRGLVLWPYFLENTRVQ
ncbi:MAG: L,D-transpeptidase family protein [Gammaproteobacteria bacterium]|nr:L,D-transpeptidase family protein [Gammaproteobacteria bacterium]NIM74767.1 L,D-transpeptidase family protein [Gammaproteobacteria bacterium]NIN39198.1 L,D-transpeptidase family protein [Gammaproteobacteria bacterium]NIO26684.1 L,D-transpeptidase family protein [Gammaproteobacteria bacterium]NIO67240.1 L,D-transpeptidase family protein [Gammaproteobacteria bacterium]